MSNVYEELKAEREYQDGKWGHAFDDNNTLNDWMQYINIHGSKAAAVGNSKEEQRKQMIKVTALGIAALETFDRNGGFAPRHYDPTSKKVFYIDVGHMTNEQKWDYFNALRKELDTAQELAAWPFPTSENPPR